MCRNGFVDFALLYLSFHGAQCVANKALVRLSRAGEESWLEDPGTNLVRYTKVVLPTSMKEEKLVCRTTKHRIYSLPNP